MRTVFETSEIEMSGVAGTGKARLNLVTSDIQEAIAGVEIIFIPLPGFAITPLRTDFGPSPGGRPNCVDHPRNLGGT